MDFRAAHMIRRAIPDRDRLVYVTGLTRVTFGYRSGYIHPALVQALGTLSAGITAEAPFDLVVDGGPAVTAWLEPCRDDLMLPGALVWPKAILDKRGLQFEIQCRASLIDPAVVTEMNDHAFPLVCGRLTVVRYG